MRKLPQVQLGGTRKQLTVKCQYTTLTPSVIGGGKLSRYFRNKAVPASAAVCTFGTTGTATGIGKFN